MRCKRFSSGILIKKIIMKITGRLGKAYSFNREGKILVLDLNFTTSK